MNDILDILEAKDLLEAATPENPVKFRIEDGCGQHLDILVADATVNIKPSPIGDEVEVGEDGSIAINIKSSFEMVGEE